MNNKLDIITFKSIPVYWDKEKTGLKSWTIRDVDKNDERFKIIEKWFDTLRNDVLQIQIQNTHTNEIFTRCVTDIYYSKNKKEVIISWKNEQ